MNCDHSLHVVEEIQCKIWVLPSEGHLARLHISSERSGLSCISSWNEKKERYVWRRILFRLFACVNARLFAHFSFSKAYFQGNGIYTHKKKITEQTCSMRRRGRTSAVSCQEKNRKDVQYCQCHRILRTSGKEIRHTNRRFNFSKQFTQDAKACKTFDLAWSCVDWLWTSVRWFCMKAARGSKFKPLHQWY